MTTETKLLLKEYTSFEYNDDDVKALEPGKPMILKGIIQKANTLNQNGRVYPRPVLEREVRNYEKLIRENRAWGELDHANEPIVNLKNVSHLIKEIWMEGDVVYGKIEVVDTPCGNILKGLVKAGGRPGISSRALGSLQRENNVNVVQDDLQIICWDMVSEPSTPGSFMYMTEAKVIDITTARKAFTKSDFVERAANDVLSLYKKP